MRSLEICAGAGGQALGLEQAGFKHVALIEIDKMACLTLKYNRPYWNVIRSDIKSFTAEKFSDIDLLSGGIPCPPFSIAGKQLGNNDERDLFPDALRLIRESQPKAIMLENVRGLLTPKFDNYRQAILNELNEMGYICEWKLVNANEFGVSQHRARSILVGLQKQYANNFKWPTPNTHNPQTVGELLYDEMSRNGWIHTANWSKHANDIAPTIVGGSKKHGGPDLGPTRARQAWLKLGVDGRGIADYPPDRNFDGMPRLTVKMASLIQGFPTNWVFVGKKTPAYRQVGNAFPPPIAEEIGKAIRKAIITTQEGENNEFAR